MLEVIFGLIPLIFICSAIGLILLNFDYVAQYVMYTFSNIISSKNVYQNVVLKNVQPPPKTDNQKNLNLFAITYVFFKRTITLFKAIFIPDISIDLRPARMVKIQSENIIEKIASKEIQKINLKTYSAVGSANQSNFRLSYIPESRKPQNIVVSKNVTDNQQLQKDNLKKDTNSELLKKVNQDPTSDPLNMISIYKAQQEATICEDKSKELFPSTKPFLSNYPISEESDQVPNPQIPLPHEMAFQEIITTPKTTPTTSFSRNIITPTTEKPFQEKLEEQHSIRNVSFSAPRFNPIEFLGKALTYLIFISPFAIILTSLVIYFLERSANAITISYLDWINTFLTENIEKILNQ